MTGPAEDIGVGTEIPLLSQFAERLVAHRRETPFAAATDWVFATSRPPRRRLPEI